MVYESVRKSYLQMMNLIQNQGVDFVLEHLSVECLFVDAHEPSLGARRAKLSLYHYQNILHITRCLITNI